MKTPFAPKIVILFLLIPLAGLFAKRPNVIVVMTDDQGYGEFSFNGNPLAETPHIDKLAAGGIRLTDFHVAPMCTPTRGQLMTGVDAFRNAASNVSSGRTLLRPDLKTMADVFKQAGYRTGIFGKWHLGDNYPFRPQDRGFDEALWFPSSHINAVPDYWDNDYFNDTYLHNGKRQKYKGYCTDIFFDEAINWIGKKSKDDEPFFAYIPLNAAHWPWFVPDEYRGPVREMVRKHPEVVAHLTEDKIENLISFLAMGANIDDNVGKLEKHLAKTRMRDDTILVFLTDNGSTYGIDYYNAGMQGKKTTLWEGGHRVPCVVNWPNGNLGHPREISELTHVQDLLPTLADLAGVKNIPGNLDGISLAPLFRGERSTLDDRMLVINYSRMPSFKVTYTDGNPAIPQRDGAGVLWRQWRLLENRELYDVRTDPHQDHNVADQFPGIVKKLSAHLQQWWDGVKDDVMKPQRVIIGNEAENPMLLTACEWLDVFVDQQVQIRNGVLRNGTWHLTVDQPGTYEFTLRRWPVESGLKLTDSLPRTKVTDGEYIEGKALPIGGAKLKIKGQPTQTAESNTADTSIAFIATLEKGPLQLDATFTDKEGKPLLGAYYVTVERF
jgi:arylsulfatase A-like enzyme